MQQTRYPIFARIGKMLHDQLEDIAREPLPDRWTDLINYLGDQERGQRTDAAESCPPKPLKN
ncbi:MAG: hypothetical protein ABW200_16440 [Hyphomicrobiaceae bacterium]|jgi:hypothetical protein